MKTKIFVSLLISLVVIVFVFQTSFAQEKSCCGGASDSTMQKITEPNQTNCPVMGGKIDKEVYVGYQGKRVYFCCASCVGTFNNDPEKYMKKMKEQGVVLEDAPVEQKTCPISGKPINEEIFTDYQGKRIYFCCVNCKEKFLESPEEYLKKM